MLKKILKTKNVNANIIEYNGITILNSLLEPYFTIKRTHEGCRADLAIKWKEEVDDSWIPVQVKTVSSLSSHNMYSFGLHGHDYSDMLLFLVAVNENKIWMMPGINGKIKKTVNISKKSKYNKYFIDSSTILDKITEYTSTISKQPFTVLNCPNNIKQQLELTYCNKRQQYLPYLNQTMSLIQSSVTDFKIGDYNIQEKVVGYDKDKKLFIAIIRRNGGKNEKGARTFIPYSVGDNHYYWLHSQIDDRFWIIPEDVFYHKGYLYKNKGDKVKTRIYFSVSKYTTTTKWLKDYEFNYIDHDKTKILELFKI
jgi:hypothetical protein